jgi:hypothetical protein
VSNTNRHGLSRTIPNDVQLKVRQRCGFGCVICGLGIYDYEHFDPEFKDARVHNPKGITLLCMRHNQLKRRKVLSVETVKRANANPRSLQQGFSNEAFDFGHVPIEIVFAGVSFKNCKHLIELGETPILSINDQEFDHEPYRISGIFCNNQGVPALKIEDNVWSVLTDNWDVECEGPRIKIRKGSRDIVLVLKSEPPERLIIERLNMNFHGVGLRGSRDLLEISYDGIH